MHEQIEVVWSQHSKRHAKKLHLQPRILWTAHKIYNVLPVGAAYKFCLMNSYTSSIWTKHKHVCESVVCIRKNVKHTQKGQAYTFYTSSIDTARNPV